MTVRHGRDTQILLQRETSFRTAPGVPAAFEMKFSTVDFGRQQQRDDDPTINANPLAEKQTVGDETPGGSIKAKLDLNDAGQWLSLLWGTPDTSGAGPYTHIFTVTLADRPSALLELGYLAAAKFPRWLGVMLDSMAWSVVDGDQSVDLNLIGATEVSPVPGAAFDAAPTAYANNYACVKAGDVYDVQGASTLGKIASADVTIANDLEGKALADALPGYGAILLGQPAIGGNISALFETGTLFDHAFAQTSKAMTLVSKNAAGDASLTLNCPQVEFGEPKHSIQTSKGLVVETTWRAHKAATPATIVLVNGIASY